MMRKTIAITQVTLDGVRQSPGGPEEDPRNGFTHGGWAMPFLDDALKQAIGETIAGEFDLLLGTPDLRDLRRLLAEPGQQPYREGVQQGDEIRRHAQPRPIRLGRLAARRR